MKILKAIPNKIPLCILDQEKNHINTTSMYNEVLPYNYITLSKLEDYYIPLKDNRLGYRCNYRYGDFAIMKGLMYNRQGIMIILYRDVTDNTTKAYINSSYLAMNPSHKTMLNKFAKFYGITSRKNIEVVYADTINSFLHTWQPTIKDYEEAEQIKMSKNFLNYKKWKTPVLV
jgi:hypothetical protein